MAIDHFIYLDSCLIKGDSSTAEVSMGLSRTRAAYAGLKHLWYLAVISLRHTKLSLVVFMHAEEVRPLEILDHRYLRNITKTG